jgi:hypothetical protein
MQHLVYRFNEWRLELMATGWLAGDRQEHQGPSHDGSLARSDGAPTGVQLTWSSTSLTVPASSSTCHCDRFESGRASCALGNSDSSAAPQQKRHAAHFAGSPQQALGFHDCLLGMRTHKRRRLGPRVVQPCLVLQSGWRAARENVDVRGVTRGVVGVYGWWPEVVGVAPSWTRAQCPTAAQSWFESYFALSRALPGL